jgi:cob(I)alamin adenosyltransferase
VPKDHARVAAYGAVDELNAALGVALAHPLDADARAELDHIQGDLFTVGAELATPPGRESASLPRVPEAWAGRLETWIDRHEESLPPLRTFILPGGTPAAAALHLARAVCRRAEREVVHLGHAEPVGGPLLRYLNRLSDYLFVLARAVNTRAGVADTPWRPGGRDDAPATPREASPDGGEARQGGTP